MLLVEFTSAEGKVGGDKGGVMGGGVAGGGDCLGGEDESALLSDTTYKLNLKN